VLAEKRLKNRESNEAEQASNKKVKGGRIYQNRDSFFRRRERCVCVMFLGMDGPLWMRSEKVRACSVCCWAVSSGLHSIWDSLIP